MSLLWTSAATAQTIYATVLGNQRYVVGSSTLRSGLFVSYDGAQNWRHVGPENLKAYSMDAVDSSSGRVLYIAAGNGVHRSTDYGQHWKIVTDWRMTEVLDVKVDQRNPNHVYAATAWGFWRSTDGGDTWENPDGELKEAYCYRLELSESGESLTDSLMVVGESSLALSVDRGNSWTISPLPASPRLLVSPSMLPSVRGFNAEYKGDQEACRTPRLIVPVWSGIPQHMYDAVPVDSGLMIGASEQGGMTTGEDSCVGWVQWGAQEATHAAAYVPEFRLWLFGTFGNGIVLQTIEKGKKPDFLTRNTALEGSQIWRIVVRNYTVPVEAGHVH